MPLRCSRDPCVGPRCTAIAHRGVSLIVTAHVWRARRDIARLVSRWRFVVTRHELGATLVWQGRAFSAGGLRRGLQRWRRHAARKNYRRRAILRAQPLVRAARRALRRWQDIRRCEAVGIVAYYSAISRTLGRALRRWAAEAMAVGQLRLLDMAWQGAQALAALRVWQVQERCEVRARPTRAAAAGCGPERTAVHAAAADAADTDFAATPSAEASSSLPPHLRSSLSPFADVAAATAALPPSTDVATPSAAPASSSLPPRALYGLSSRALSGRTAAPLPSAARLPARFFRDVAARGAPPPCRHRRRRGAGRAAHEGNICAVVGGGDAAREPPAARKGLAERSGDVGPRAVARGGRRTPRRRRAEPARRPAPRQRRVAGVAAPGVRGVAAQPAAA